MRAILALSMLLVTFIDPSEPQHFVVLTYATLIVYSLYSIVLYIISFRKPDWLPVNYAHWIDLVWCLILIALSSGTSSVYFFLYFFAIQIAAFRFGLGEGLRITIASVLSFILLGFLTSTGSEFELNRFLLRPVYLGVLGYMISYWGGIELKLKKRLDLIKDINNLYNPRFGTDLTVSSILQKILVSFDADDCLLVSLDAASATYTLRQCDRDNPERAISAEPIENDHPLIKSLGDNAVIYSDLPRWKELQGSKTYFVFDLETRKRVAEPVRSGEVLADLLNTRSFISVPFYQRETLPGRLFLTSNTKNFDLSDVDFLRQILKQAVPVIENVGLLDRLASEATEEQRKKISRDIHDSTIQPYIGVKLGLEALKIKHASGEDIGQEIDRLVEIANSNIKNIRRYVDKLKGDENESEKGVVLVSAIKQKAKKDGEFYGINIRVETGDEIHLSDRLSAEIFQIVTEGLSNIRRHTKADEALIKIACCDKTLKLEIENNHSNGSDGGFVPKSIAGRAESLGGHVAVVSAGDRTKIAIDIPI